MQAIARTPLLLGSSIPERRREIDLTQEQLAAKAACGSVQFRTLRGQLQLASTQCCGRLPHLTWNWWFGRAPSAHPKTLKNSSNGPPNLARPSKSLSQQSSCRATSTRDSGGNLLSIRRVIAGVGLGPARITHLALTRTGIPGRSRAGRFREFIAGRRYSTASDLRSRTRRNRRL